MKSVKWSSKIGVSCSVALYLSLQRVVATFNPNTGILKVTKKHPLKKSVNALQISDIINIEVVKGLGSTGAFCFIKVSTKEQSYPLTSIGALSKSELELKAKELESYWCRSTL